MNRPTMTLGSLRSKLTLMPRPSSQPGRVGEFGLVHVLRNIHGLACWYVDSRIPLRGARFPFPAPPHEGTYPLMFQGPLQFNAAQAEIRFDARYLALPLRRDEKALQQMLQRALPLTVLQYRRDRLLVQQVRQALAAHPETTHKAEPAASRSYQSQVLAPTASNDAMPSIPAFASVGRAMTAGRRWLARRKERDPRHERT